MLCLVYTTRGAFDLHGFHSTSSAIHYYNTMLYESNHSHDQSYNKIIIHSSLVPYYAYPLDWDPLYLGEGECMMYITAICYIIILFTF